MRRINLHKPSPHSYYPPRLFEKVIPQAKSFGLSKEHYKRNYLPHCLKVMKLEEQMKFEPGPGGFGGGIGIGVGKRASTLGKRVGMFNDQPSGKVRPSPISYQLNHSLTDSKRYANITMGVGPRSKLTLPSPSPGPGTYGLPSCFDKYT